MSAALAAVEETAAGPTYEFDDDFQLKIAALTLRDPMFAQRTDGLIAPEYLGNDAQQAMVRLGVDYFARYKKVPDRGIWGTLIKDAVESKRIRKDLVPELRTTIGDILKTDISDRDIVIDKVAEFARHQAIEAALIKSVDLLAKRDFDTIQKLITAAKDVGIAEDAGAYSYGDMIDFRTERRKSIAEGTYAFDGITTGHKELDKLLYHRGWGRKELSVWMAPAKGGKSTALQENAYMAWLAGYNVLYPTFEVSADITADRMDAAMSDTMMKELNLKPFEVAKTIKEMKEKTKGVLEIHEYASGTCKPSQIRRLIERYRARGIVFDMVCPDYADIMAPERRVESITENSKSIYMDLRAIAFDYNCAVVTATQTNRDGAKHTVASATDVAEDYNKIRIADIVISINALAEEKAAGEARLYFAAVRNGEDGFTLNIKQDRSKMKFIKSIVGRS